MRITTLIVGALQTNCYIIGDEITKEGIIIDPASNPERIMQEITKNQLDIKAILLTHGHFDHIGAIEELKRNLNVQVYAHESEQIILENPEFNLSSVFSHHKTKFKADKLFVDGDKFVFGKDIELAVIHTPGHTLGSVSYYCKKENILFSGDTLFYLSMGRTDFPYGNYQDLMISIKDKLFLLPDETKVFSGHGNETSIGKEKRENPCITTALWE